MPRDTIFRIQLTEGQVCTATARWAREDRMGVEFSLPLRLDDDGRIAAVTGRESALVTRPALQRRTG